MTVLRCKHVRRPLSAHMGVSLRNTNEVVVGVKSYIPLSLFATASDSACLSVFCFFIFPFLAPADLWCRL